MPLDHRDLWDITRLKSVLRTSAVAESTSFLYFFAVMSFDRLQFTAILAVFNVAMCLRIGQHMKEVAQA